MAKASEGTPGINVLKLSEEPTEFGVGDPVDEQTVNPWSVQTNLATGVDYMKLISKC